MRILGASRIAVTSARARLPDSNKHSSSPRTRRRDSVARIARTSASATRGGLRHEGSRRRTRAVSMAPPTRRRSRRRLARVATRRRGRSTRRRRRRRTPRRDRSPLGEERAVRHSARSRRDLRPRATTFGPPRAHATAGSFVARPAPSTPLRNSIRRAQPRTHSSRRRERARWRPRRGSTSPSRPGNTAETPSTPSSPRRASDETPSPRRSSPRTSRETLRRLSRIPRGDSRARGAAFASRRSRRRPGSRRGKTPSRPRALARHVGGRRARPSTPSPRIRRDRRRPPRGARSRAARKYRRHPCTPVGRPSIGNGLIVRRSPDRVQPSVASITIRALTRAAGDEAQPRAKTNARLSSRRSSAPGARSNARAPRRLGWESRERRARRRSLARTPRGRRVRRRLKRNTRRLSRARRPPKAVRRAAPSDRASLRVRPETR